jgi:hypothetical protein
MPNVTVGIVITPSKYYTDDGVPAIRSLNVKDGRLADDDLVFFSEEDNWKLANTRIYKGDVVIVRTGQSGFLGCLRILFPLIASAYSPLELKGLTEREGFSRDHLAQTAVNTTLGDNNQCLCGLQAHS